MKGSGRGTVAQLWYYLGTSLEEVRKSMKNLYPYTPLSHKPREANQTIQDRWVVHHCLEVSASSL
jgi:hypothetical protein